MKRKQLRFGKGFRVAIDSRRAQAAEMVIAPADAEGDPQNRLAALTSGCTLFRAPARRWSTASATR